MTAETSALGGIRVIDFTHFIAGLFLSDLGAPTLGQHTADVLRSVLGLSDRQIAELEGAGIIKTAVPGQRNAERMLGATP